MSTRLEDIGRMLDVAYPYRFLRAMGVDFVRDETGLPEVKQDDVWTRVTLRGFDYGGERDIKISRRLSEIQQHAAIPARNVSGSWYVTGGEISDRMDAAVRELNEAPPFYVP